MAQANETAKQNRELLKSVRRKPELRRYYEKDEKRGVVNIHYEELSDAERANIIDRLAAQHRVENAKRIVVLLVSAVITTLIFVVLSLAWLDDFIRLWR